MFRANGVYVVDLDLYIPTATYDEARDLALRIASETGNSRLIFG